MKVRDIVKPESGNIYILTGFGNPELQVCKEGSSYFLKQEMCGPKTDKTHINQWSISPIVFYAILETAVLPEDDPDEKVVVSKSEFERLQEEIEYAKDALSSLSGIFITKQLKD